MTDRRRLRLAALACIVAGGFASALTLAGPLAGVDGSAIALVSVPVGTVTLIAARPRTTTRKDITA